MTTNQPAPGGAAAGAANARIDPAPVDPRQLRPGQVNTGPVSSGQAEPDWTDQVTDLVVGAVDAVRDKTTGPILLVARGAVYGVVALFVGLFALGLLTVAFVRVLSLIPGPQWLVYAVAGAILVLGGFFAWSKRGPIDG